MSDRNWNPVRQKSESLSDIARNTQTPSKGRDLYGAEQKCQVAVADIGPMLVLKLNAFGGPTGRRHPKDAYDILLAVTRFVDGPQAAIAAFRAEGETGNTGHASAMAALRNDFSYPKQDGPKRDKTYPVWRGRQTHSLSSLLRLLRQPMGGDG